MYISTEILEGCRQQSRSHQELAYQQLYPRMTAIAKRYVSNLCDAQDVFNNAMFKAFTKIDTFRGNHLGFESWIRRIVINEAILFIRKTKRFKEEFLEETSTSSLLQYHDQNRQIENETEDYLFDLLEQLDLKTKTIFNLFVIEGYSHKEIATILSITVTNSKWHVHKARKCLREILKTTHTYEK